MLLKRLYDTKLAQASYLLGCQATGEALVVDPNRDVAQYVEAAAAEGLRITHVTETHIHADFVSGTRELAGRTGARPYLSAEGGADWSYAWSDEAGAVLLHDGDSFMVGNIRLQALHTPGHTPEHLTFLVTDTAATEVPIGVFTGDFVFVGDVGRPDLLERAAGRAGTMEAGARTLFQSLQRFAALPDHLQLWPGHGAGSACGKALGAVPSTTLGYERLVNWALAEDDEDEFVAKVLAGQPEPPAYFAQMKRINRDGPRVLGESLHPPRLSAERLREIVAAGGVVVDTRPAADFAAGHLHGTIGIPYDRSFTTWAGWLLPYDRPVHLLVAGDVSDADAVARDLAMIGLDRIDGWAGADVLAPAPADGTLERTVRATPDQLAPSIERGDMRVVDVRWTSEWNAGHLPGAMHLPIGELQHRLGEIPRDRPIVVHCQSGVRSAIATSILQAAGITQVTDMLGGFAAWRAAGLPVESAPASDAAPVPEVVRS